MHCRQTSNIAKVDGSGIPVLAKPVPDAPAVPKLVRHDLYPDGLFKFLRHKA
jgi:hypothetical protein